MSEDRVRSGWLVFEMSVLVALLLLLNLRPNWVGVVVSLDPAEGGWRFLPLLTADFAAHLPRLNLWLGLSLLLRIVLLGWGRWQISMRWVQCALRFFGALILLRMATGEPVLGPDPERRLTSGEEALADLIATCGTVGLMLACVGTAISATHLLVLLLSGSKPLRRFIRDGMAGKSLLEIFDLFSKDTGRAYQVLDRDQTFGPEPEGWTRRTFHRMKVLFFGISRQLSPARRLLFAACVALALFNGLSSAANWSLVAPAGLILLLMLELVDRVRLRDELEVARHLQRDLLPASSPDLPGYRIAHSYRTANEIGGDYYDFLEADGSRMAIVVGDASGHGMAAGLIMAIANATLKAAVDLDPDPERVLTQMNRALVRTGDRRAFMTFFYGLLDPESGRLDFLSAGHPYPLLRRASGEVVELGKGSLPLGLREPLVLDAESITIEPGDRLVLFSDGLPEAMDQGGSEAFGFGRLQDLAASAGDSAQIHDRILNTFDAHTGHEPLADDLTLVVLDREPE